MGAEIWKDIPGYEGAYQVSNMGRVKSLPRVRRCGKDGKGVRLIPEKILSPGRSSGGHLSVVLGHKANGSLVHVLVMLAFVGPRPTGADICHNNGDPTDNRLENLRYDTRTANILDVYKCGGRWQKLSVDEVRLIRSLLDAGVRGVDVAREFGVSQNCVSSIKHRRTFAWLQ